MLLVCKITTHVNLQSQMYVTWGSEEISHIVDRDLKNIEFRIIIFLTLSEYLDNYIFQRLINFNMFSNMNHGDVRSRFVYEPIQYNLKKKT